MNNLKIAPFSPALCLGLIDNISNLLLHHFLLIARHYIYISSRIFENIPQNEPEYSHRDLAIARFLVTAVRKNIGGLLLWLVSLSSSVPELTRHGCCKSVVPFRQSCSGRVCALVMSAFSLSCQIHVTFAAHWPMKAFPSSTC